MYLCSYLFKTRLIRFDFRQIIFSFCLNELFSFISVRSNNESISNVIVGISSLIISGVCERLVVQAVDVFKPESVVIIVITLGIEGHGDDKRRNDFIEDFN